MNRIISAPGCAPPAANYAHAVVSDSPGRMLHTSGVVPTCPDGTVPTTEGDQATQIWNNIGEMLAEADMASADIVSMTTYVIPGQDLGQIMAARDIALDGHLAASTLVIVPELAQSAWKVEISIVAIATH